MAGIFAKKANIWNHYRVTISLREKLMGGVPKDPKIIEGWLKTKMGTSNEEETKQQLYNTLLELGYDLKKREEYNDEKGLERLIDMQNDASSELAAVKNTNGFKFDEHGLYIEGRQLKAALKESTNILWGGVRTGPTKKGFKSFISERLMVIEDKVYLGIQEPDGIETVIGHVTGPQGPRSTLGYSEYAYRPTLTFHIKELKVLQTGQQLNAKGGQPALTLDQYGELLTCMEEQGIGAMRSMQHGRFDALALEPVSIDDVPETSGIVAEAEKVVLEAAKS